MSCHVKSGAEKKSRIASVDEVSSQESNPGFSSVTD